MNSPLLRCRGISVGYPGRNGQALFHKLDFDLQPGEVVGLLGRNGVGKSTFLRTLAGLQPPLSGSLERLPMNQPTIPQLEGAAAPPELLVPQALHPGIAWVTPLRSYPREMTGWELVALGRHPHTAWHGHLTSEDEVKINEAMRACGAGLLAQRALAELSDGERQRLCIARGVAQEARILLLDEPTAFLDAPGRLSVFRLARKLAHQEGRGLILSTHDLDLAKRSCDRLLILRRKQQPLLGLPHESQIEAEIKAEFEVEELF